MRLYSNTIHDYGATREWFMSTVLYAECVSMLIVWPDIRYLISDDMSNSKIGLSTIFLEI